MLQWYTYEKVTIDAATLDFFSQNLEHFTIFQNPYKRVACPFCNVKRSPKNIQQHIDEEHGDNKKAKKEKTKKKAKKDENSDEDFVATPTTSRFTQYSKRYDTNIVS